MPKKQKLDVDYCGFKPGQRVDVLHYRDDKAYYIKGYTVLDHEVKVRSSKGEVKRVLKPKQKKRLVDHVPVCFSPDGRCITYHLSRVRLAAPDAVPFSHVFGTALEGGITFKGYRIDEADDLTLGMEVQDEEEES